MRHVSEGELHAYLDGALDAYPAPEAKRIRAHLERCDECRVELERARELVRRAKGLLDGTAPVVDDPPPFEQIRRRSAVGVPEDGSEQPSGRGRRRWLAGLGWAASVALALGVGWGVASLSGPGASGSGAVSEVADDGGAVAAESGGPARLSDAWGDSAIGRDTAAGSFAGARIAATPPETVDIGRVVRGAKPATGGEGGGAGAGAPSVRPAGGGASADSAVDVARAEERVAVAEAPTPASVEPDESGRKAGDPEPLPTSSTGDATGDDPTTFLSRLAAGSSDSAGSEGAGESAPPTPPIDELVAVSADSLLRLAGRREAGEPPRTTASGDSLGQGIQRTGMRNPSALEAPPATVGATGNRGAPVAFYSELSGDADSVVEASRRQEAAPARTLVIPGLEVESVEWTTVAPGVPGLRVVQRLAGDTARVELRFGGAGLTVPRSTGSGDGDAPEILIPASILNPELPEGVHQVVAPWGGGWVALRGRLPETGLRSLLRVLR